MISDLFLFNLGVLYAQCSFWSHRFFSPPNPTTNSHFRLVNRQLTKNNLPLKIQHWSSPLIKSKNSQIKIVAWIFIYWTPHTNRSPLMRHRITMNKFINVKTKWIFCLEMLPIRNLIKPSLILTIDWNSDYCAVLWCGNQLNI